jgi:hypothetical protein
MVQDQACWVDRRRYHYERDEGIEKGAGLGDIVRRAMLGTGHWGILA